MSQKAIDKISDAIALASHSRSSLRNGVLSIKSTSGLRTRHFINNMCSTEDKFSYLEFGILQGATICSAIYKNKIRAVGVDNWVEYNNEPVFNAITTQQNIDEFGEQSKCRIITSDVFLKSTFGLGKFDFIYFDAGQNFSYTNQKNVLKYYVKNFKNTLYAACSYWNIDIVRKYFFECIEDSDYNIVFKNEMFTHIYNDNTWGYGLAVFALEKQ